VKRVFYDLFDNKYQGNQTHHEHFDALNPKLALQYEWAPKNKVYVSLSRSFQPPSFDESIQIASPAPGQPNAASGPVFNPLHAQHAITIEVGTKGELGPVEWDLALYHSWVREELLDLNNSLGVDVGTVNAPRTTHEGIESEIEVELAHSIFEKGTEKMKQDRIVFQQAYTLNDFRFRSNPAYGNNRIAGTPIDYYKAELRYEHPCGLYLGTNVEWSIIKYPVDEANTLFADPYALLGFRIGYQAPKGLEVFFEAKNLTNKIYAASVTPIADARQNQDNDTFNPGNGRSFYGGVTWRW
jgi:iron complex outermembrane receptor protein